MKSILFIFLWSFATMAFSQCIEGNCNDGKGTYKYSDGTIYTGPFKSGKYEGKGKIIYSNGDIYVGAFKNNDMNGKGKYTWFESGSVYEGGYVNGARTGQGVVKFKNGTIEKGTYLNDEFIKGLITYSDGTKEKYPK